LAARAGALDSRFRGNDTTLKDLILNGWVAADLIASVVIGRRITADPDLLTESERTCKQPLWPNLGRSPQSKE
jgi:hypothetical protein